MQLFVQSQREAGDHDELIQIESEDEIGDDFGLACEAPEGYVDRGGDCDDADVSSYPGAEEICGDRRGTGTRPAACTCSRRVPTRTQTSPTRTPS